MPEDFDTLVNRIVVHAKSQMACVESSVQKQEYETAEFCAKVLADDITTLRQLLNHKLTYLKQQQQR